MQSGEWDVWLRNLRTCLPGAPPGLLERRLIRFLDWGVEAARDLRQPDFLPFITTALSSLDSGVWESLLHDSMSPRLPMHRIREVVLRRGLGVVGNIPIPADIWEPYVPESFASVASHHCPGGGPPSDEAVVMLHALRSQMLLLPLPPGSPGPNWGVFAIPKTLDKCEKLEKFSLPGLVGAGGRAGFIVFPALLLWSGPVPPAGLGGAGSPGGGGGDEELCMCYIDPTNCFWSLRLLEAFWGAFRVSDGEGGVLSFK